jgi:hypothetical protein
MFILKDGESDVQSIYYFSRKTLGSRKASHICKLSAPKSKTIPPLIAEVILWNLTASNLKTVEHSSFHLIMGNDKISINGIFTALRWKRYQVKLQKYSL